MTEAVSPGTLGAMLFLLAACVGPGGPATPPELLGDTGAAACAAWTYADETASWALPATAAGFTRAERLEPDCDAGAPATRLADLTGDGLPDLVQLSDCDDDTVGQVTWRVWPGEEAGFGDEIAWALPDGYAAGAFVGASRDDAACDDGDLPAWRLADLDGDGRDDLVITESCADDTLADGAWLVFANTGLGFGAGVRRELGGGYSREAFVAPRSTAVCAAGANRPAWGLVDIDGDGPLDLVITQSCTVGEVGGTYWQVLDNDGSAFGAGTTWFVPPEVGATSLESPTNGCPAQMVHFLLDVEGDGRPDLVVPRPCEEEGSDWRVYTNKGTSYSLVDERRAAPLYLNFFVTARERMAPDCDVGAPAWVLDEVTGDGRVDLTMTANCLDATVGETRWDRWAATADGWTEHAPIALPDGYSPGTFLGSAGSDPGCGGTASRPAWLRVDLDGNGVPELVVTEACDDPAVGAERWRVHALTCADAPGAGDAGAR